MVLKYKEQTMKRFDVICIGVTLLDLPLGPLDDGVLERETTMVDHIALTTGGDALNEAIILSRLGKKTALIGHIGKDFLGEIIVRRCEEERVETGFLVQEPGAATRINVVVIGRDGQRHFVKTQSAVSASFAEEQIDPRAICNARAISLASIFSSKLRDPLLLRKIAQTARDSGVVTFADMVPMTGGETLADLADVMPYLDFFMPNQEEAALLTGASDPEKMADLLLQTGVGTVIVKLGQAGCLIKNAEECLQIPAFSVDAVDTTGAGDNFAAAFISAVLDGLELKECGIFACAAAALSTLVPGASGGVVNKAQVDGFISEKYPMGLHEKNSGI